MEEKKFLSVQEISELTGKSESTIKRFIKTTYSKDDSNDGQKYAKVVSKKKAPKGYFWSVEENFVREYFGIPQEKKSQNDEMIKILSEQLKEKDKQIENLLERQREQNILTKTLQDKVLALEPGEKKSDEPVVDHEEKTAKKKGFWKKIFG